MPLALNTTPDKPRVNLSELALLLRAFYRAWRPGLCARTLLAGIVATATLQGLDLSQEAAYAESKLTGPTMQVSR